MEQNISIHAPREGGDLTRYKDGKGNLEFQSTPPARGATLEVLTMAEYIDHFNPRPPRGGRRWRRKKRRVGYNFNPRPPRGGRRDIYVTVAQMKIISIHAPREGGDLGGSDNG